MTEYQLNRFLEQHGQAFREIDKQFAKFCLDLSKDDHLAIIALLVSDQLGQGNVCFDISQPHSILSESELSELCHLAKQANSNDQNFPLVFEGSRIYLQRYHQYECFVEQAIRSRCQQYENDLEVDSLLNMINNLFPPNYSKQEIDWQKVAVSVAVQSAFTVISGGPGTGKTTTVIKLLALLIEQYKVKGRQPIIRLAAPTGKAAMRLTESIGQAKHRLQVDEHVKDAIPEEASTLHRLLKRNREGDFYFNQMNPLHLDILVVDEASMIDLPMMAKLLAALPKHGQLVLLGDKDQLSSVEAGSVLADICDSGTRHGFSESQLKLINQLTDIPLDQLKQNVAELHGAEIRNHVCHLRKSHRFSDHSGIAALARAANNGDVNRWQQIFEGDFSDLNFFDLTESNRQTLILQSAKLYSEYQNLIASDDNSDAVARRVHEVFNRYRILCAVKEGELGVAGINQSLEQALGYQETWYAGRPIMIQQNDYGLNLYNGDVGIVLPRLIDGKTQLRAAFLNADSEIRWLQPARLPQHETVYAMTVHKSQGSEFEHCALVLPEYPAPVLTKELLYTGITRAKARLTLLARDKLIAYTLRNQVQRASGLRDRLWTVEKAEFSPETGQFSLF
ncbi:exodeoxyribonuclease V subunit alpha [Bermanella marisrubri]|uniref:RecBCD enzyme subunit RecD n=1 Tax=Bermanella marisrubri TaxID=207949 RepID=Q1N2Q9_9GAMM|nr:exodeoxyribonuclease V subunit alpha [Bermanella marisrubri]EAT12610.1 exodeoxyribonuclease V alpha chain [Oceanobacter sp. RED65] [Bermanella marisrubri]QIZ84837.1 exodeoxyribonuclease V subunit alpha [Bermanella marisrubri]